MGKRERGILSKKKIWPVPPPASPPSPIILSLSQDVRISTESIIRAPFLRIGIAICEGIAVVASGVKLKEPYVGELSGAGWSGVDRMSLRRRASSPARCLRKK